MENKSPKSFRVIVVGAGVTGLTFSHALQKAGIDHVVIEKGEVAPQWGASIGMHSHGCRILDQLGCLEEVEKLCVPMEQSFNRMPSGEVLSSSKFFKYINDQ